MKSIYNLQLLYRHIRYNEKNWKRYMLNSGFLRTNSGTKVRKFKEGFSNIKPILVHWFYCSLVHWYARVSAVLNKRKQLQLLIQTQKPFHKTTP